LEEKKEKQRKQQQGKSRDPVLFRARDFGSLRHRGRFPASSGSVRPGTRGGSSGSWTARLLNSGGTSLSFRSPLPIRVCPGPTRPQLGNRGVHQHHEDRIPVSRSHFLYVGEDILRNHENLMSCHFLNRAPFAKHGPFKTLFYEGCLTQDRDMCGIRRKWM